MCAASLAGYLGICVESSHPLNCRASAGIRQGRIISMKKLRLLSLCSGIGGADLAAEWTGAIEIAGQVELDDFCIQVLEQHWPHVKRLHAGKDVQGDEFGRIDLVAGGIPYQPFS